MYKTLKDRAPVIPPVPYTRDQDERQEEMRRYREAMERGEELPKSLSMFDIRAKRMKELEEVSGFFVCLFYFQTCPL